MIEAVAGRAAGQPLVHRQVGAVEEQAGVGGLGHAGEELEQMQVADEGGAWRVLRQDLEADRLAQRDDALGHRRDRLGDQHRRQQQHVPAIAAPEVPQTGVAAQPRRPEYLAQRPHAGEPRGIEVLRLVEVDVEEVVGRRRAGGRPRERRGVETLDQLDPDLEEAGVSRVLAPQLRGVERARGEARPVLGRDPRPSTGRRSTRLRKSVSAACLAQGPRAWQAWPEGHPRRRRPYHPGERGDLRGQLEHRRRLPQPRPPQRSCQEQREVGAGQAAVVVGLEAEAERVDARVAAGEQRAQERVSRGPQVAAGRCSRSARRPRACVHAAAGQRGAQAWTRRVSPR